MRSWKMNLRISYNAWLHSSKMFVTKCVLLLKTRFDLLQLMRIKTWQENNGLFHLLFSFTPFHVHWVAHNLPLSLPTWTMPARFTRTSRMMRTVWLRWAQDAKKFVVITAWLQINRYCSSQTLSLCRSDNTQQLILPQLTHSVSGSKIHKCLFTRTKRKIKTQNDMDGCFVTDK